MKQWLLAGSVLLLAACTGSSEGHENTHSSSKPLTTIQPGNALAPVDRSAMDMAYFPVDFPILKTSGKGGAQPRARVIYSRPSRQGRAIFGTLVPYGQPWRLGANEATELELFSPATIQQKRVAKGRYTLYCIPQPDRWTLVFNSNLYTWGLNPDSSRDVQRFTVPVVQTARPMEHFTMAFAPKDGGAELIIAWEQAEARLPIEFK